MALAKSHLTPKELADAIGASESSMRRWVDGGQIRMSRTAGGHRRIPVEEAIRFIREAGAPLVHPEVIGLSDLSLAAPGDAAASDDQRLFEALLVGDRRLAKGLIVSWYLEGRSLATLFDGPIRAALSRLGEIWQHEQHGILVEHRATEICLEILHELRAMLSAVQAEAPLALGGAPEGDPYLVPCAMVALVLAEAGYREVNYGAQTPLHLLADAAAEQDAAVVWVSITAPPDKRRVERDIADLAGRIAARNTPIVLGGRHAAEVLPRALANVHLANSMTELAAFARGVRTVSPPHAD
jgi:MerR family transcriptional regulator, light-induced transcriptional regulator